MNVLSAISSSDWGIIGGTLGSLGGTIGALVGISFSVRRAIIDTINADALDKEKKCEIVRCVINWALVIGILLASFMASILLEVIYAPNVAWLNLCIMAAYFAAMFGISALFVKRIKKITKDSGVQIPFAEIGK